MPRQYKTNSVIVLLLAVLFYAFFTFTKHNPALSTIIPFGDDPYDAISSFGMIVSILLAVLSLIRAFRPYASGLPSAQQKAFLARTQVAVSLGTLIPLAGDAIAMARYPSMWLGTNATEELLALVVGMTILSLIVMFYVRNSTYGTELSLVSNQWQMAVITSVIFVVILAFYPQNIISSTPGELFTLGAGIVLLFVPQSALVVALLPYATKNAGSGSHTPGLLSRRWLPWGIAALLGIAVGTAALLGEVSDAHNSIPLVRLITVAAVFVGTGLVGLLVGYSCLRNPLGLFLD